MRLESALREFPAANCLDLAQLALEEAPRAKEPQSNPERGIGVPFGQHPRGIPAERLP
jgi:hypothetical protein